MGVDSLFQFVHWYHPEEIAKYAVVLAVSRGSMAAGQMEGQAELLAARFQGNFELIQMEKMDVSSSLIREKLIKGEEVRGMLPKKVYEYIMENGCYGLDKE